MVTIQWGHLNPLSQVPSSISKNSKMSDITPSWNRIVAWLETNAPNVLSQHQPGVADAELNDLESALGHELPEDVKQFYKLINGDNPNEASSGIFPSVDDYDQMAFGPLAISQLQREWEIQNELLEGGDFEGCEPEECDPEIRNESWNAGWIPLAGNGGGDLYCIDMVPAEGGNVGQIISHNHETFNHKVVAKSFGEFLESLANRLESGELTFSEQWGVGTPE